MTEEIIELSPISLLDFEIEENIYQIQFKLGFNRQEAINAINALSAYPNFISISQELEEALRPIFFDLNIKEIRLKNLYLLQNIFNFISRAFQSHNVHFKSKYYTLDIEEYKETFTDLIYKQSQLAVVIYPESIYANYDMYIQIQKITKDNIKAILNWIMQDLANENAWDLQL